MELDLVDDGFYSGVFEDLFDLLDGEATVSVRDNSARILSLSHGMFLSSEVDA